MKKTVYTIGILQHALRSLRCERGLTQEQLGAFLGVNRQRISQIETNPGSIRVTRLLALLRQLDATLAIHYTPAPSAPEAGSRSGSEAPQCARRTR